MTLIKLTNGVPEGLPIGDNNFRALFPEANFGPILESSIVETYGYGLYDFTVAPKCGKYEKPSEVAPVKDGRGIWMQTWGIIPMNDSEKSQVDARQSQFVRERRNQYLYQSDWSQLSDNQLTTQEKSAWTTYRQALRDVTLQSGFPWDVKWPTKPQ